MFAWSVPLGLDFSPSDCINYQASGTCGNLTTSHKAYCGKPQLVVQEEGHRLKHRCSPNAGLGMPSLPSSYRARQHDGNENNWFQMLSPALPSSVNQISGWENWGKMPQCFGGLPYSFFGLIYLYFSTMFIFLQHTLQFYIFIFLHLFLIYVYFFIRTNITQSERCLI